MNGLSKTRILNHRQCPKRLWLEANRPELAEVDASMQARFDTGNQVGELARALYPDGVLIDEPNLTKALAQTASVLASAKHPIFEATFQFEGVLIRADLLIPDEGGYRMVEVKSSTEVKPYHLDDATIQTWVARQAGIRIARTEVACIDKTFVYPGDGNYNGLLKHVDVTDATRRALRHIPFWVQAAKFTLKGGEPTIAAGEQCRVPYACPFLGSCSPLPRDALDHYPVDILPRAKKLVGELRLEGHQDIRDIPLGRLQNATHERIRRVCISGHAELSPQARAELLPLGYPHYFMDFETIGLAVPIWRDTRPYQAVPFQWSCHLETQSGAIEHREFLASGLDDPQRAFAESLIAALGERGPIFVYNAGTERSHMQHLALRFPDLAPALNAAIDRIVDLLPIARAHYYHPAMRGSWSIKEVLPTIAPELAYDGLEVGNGTQAQQVFAQLLNPVLSPARRASLRAALLGYCARDTLAMVKLVHFFKKGNAV